MTNVTASNPTCRKSAQEECPPELVSSSTMTVRDVDLNRRADELFTDEVEMIATALNHSAM